MCAISAVAELIVSCTSKAGATKFGLKGKALNITGCYNVVVKHDTCRM